MLLQTVSKTEECQRGFMNLLLEAIVMVFSASEDVRSQVLLLIMLQIYIETRTIF